MDEIKRIATRYKDCGVTEEFVRNMCADGIRHGFSEKVALAGIRLALSMEFGKEEYFSMDETAEIFGVEESAVRKLVEENEEEMFNAGMITKVSMALPM